MNNQLIIKMVLDAWNAKVREATALFENLSDEQLLKEVAPNRNRGIYLLGHLTAVHDRLLPLLDMGAQMYPQLNEGFISSPDKSKPELTPVSELRQHWKNVHATLANQFDSLSPEKWLEKHTSVSAEDFAKEPHRNKLNVVISRTNHLAYHLGQLIFLKN